VILPENSSPTTFRPPSHRSGIECAAEIARRIGRADIAPCQSAPDQIVTLGIVKPFGPIIVRHRIAEAARQVERIGPADKPRVAPSYTIELLRMLRAHVKSHVLGFSDQMVLVPATNF
jgi:hypothetical protein